ncbi:MAG TPA: sigma-70 family RNA polymerase sigma factor, partial [Gemmatimonadales bacterium]|nr:sigma-70 family RNA polymerase sigma factor [Gemmatimonadales bacterium]
METQAPSDAAAKDAALARRAAAGDPKAFELLVRRHYERCLRFALHLLGDRRDAEEAVQDTFVRAHRALPGYEERQRFEAWLFRVLVNRCRTMAARRRRMERTVVALAGGDGAADPADERP